MKTIAVLLASLALISSASADVLPGQAGIYEGTYSTLSVDTTSKKKQKHKTKVLCVISNDGATTITSDDGLLIEGDLNAGERYGFFSASDEFVTQTGIWKFKKKGKVRARLQYGVSPGGDVTFIVEGKLRLKQQVSERENEAWSFYQSVYQ